MDLKDFTALNKVADTADYVSALEAFDRIPQLQELKSLAKSRGGIDAGKSVLDVGCGFGLETLRLAQEVQPKGRLTGLDKSDAFVAEARTRAAACGLPVDFLPGDAAHLPFEDARFDCVRAERLLIYLEDFEAALDEMRRVLRPGGRLALIEPDFSTNTINVSDRDVLNRVLEHEVSHAVSQPCLPGPLLSALKRHGFQDIEIATRVLIFPQDLAASYFKGLGTRAETAGVISGSEGAYWRQTIDSLRETDEIFATIGYFLFTATRA